MKKEEQVKSGFWKNVGLLMVLVIVVANFWLIWQISTVVNRVDKYNQGVVDELGSMKGDVRLFADDLNEIRRFLLLPEKAYSVAGEVGEVKEPEQEQNNQNAVALFAMLDSMVKEEQAIKNKLLAAPIFEALFANQEILNQVTQAGLILGDRGELQMKFNDNSDKRADGTINTLKGQPLYNLVFVPTENVFKVQSALGEQKLSDYNAAGFSAELLGYLSKNSEAVRVKKIADQEAASKAAGQADLEVKKILEDQKNELESMVKDAAFVETLSTIGLKVIDKSREENNKYIFDVVDSLGKVKFSLALELTSGMIKVIRNNQEIDLKNFLEQEGSKKKS